MRGIVMDRRSVVFKFEGDVEEISVETFTQAVMGYSHLVQIAAKELDPNMRVDVNISAIRPGCLEAVMSAIANGLPGLLAGVAGVAGDLAPILEAVTGYLELKKFLASNGAPTKIEQRGEVNVVMTQNGGTMNVTNNVIKIDGSAEAAKTLQGLFSSLDDNEKVSGVSIEEDGSTASSGFTAEHKEFASIASAPSCTVDSTRTMIDGHAQLAVSKAVLEPSSSRKWEFYYRGNKISAPVIDTAFYEKLLSHSWTFGIGDYIDADLEVTQKLNSIGIWENSRYRVVKVHDVLASPADQELF